MSLDKLTSITRSIYSGGNFFLMVSLYLVSFLELVWKVVKKQMLRYQKGPRIDPSGKSHIMFEEIWITVEYIYFKVWLEPIHELRSQWSYFFKNISQLILSNIFGRKINIMPLTKPLSKPFKKCSFINTRREPVE